MSLREQWIRPLDALPQDYQHVIAITSSGQEEEMYLVDDKWHIVDGVRIPIECVVFWHEKREQPTVEMAEDCVSREKVLYMITSGKYLGEDDEQFIDRLVNELSKMPSVQPQPKRGKWISIDDGGMRVDGYCSECNIFIPKNVREIMRDYCDGDFCSNCGTRMDADIREVHDEIS